LPVKIRWQSKKLQIQGAQILRNEAYLQYAAMTKDAVQRSPSALLRAVSMSNGPSTLLRTVSLSNGLSNGSWTFYEAIRDEWESVPRLIDKVKKEEDNHEDLQGS
jgi:hypothetical protein